MDCGAQMTVGLISTQSSSSAEEASKEPKKASRRRTRGI